MNKIKITPELLAELKEKAQKATPGPWKNPVPNGCVMCIKCEPEQYRFGNDHNDCSVAWTDFKNKEDADYIAAANPAVVLELIARIERLEADNYSPEILNDPQAMTAVYAAGAMAESRKRIAEADALMAKVERLKKEADWLAAAQQYDVPDDEPSRCPEGHEPPRSCVKPTCAACWREAARKAVQEQTNV